MQEVIDQDVLRKTIAANVLRLRRDRGWSQTELADKIGISYVHLNRIENERATPSAEVLYALADVFGVSADSLRQLSEKILAS